MDLNALFSDDRAASPVIGVILMVSITVILAAVIGTFVLGLGTQIQSTAPQASLTFDGDAGTDVTVVHQGGEPVPVSTVSLQYTNASGASVTEPVNDVPGSTWTAGETATTDDHVEDDTNVQVVWQAGDSDKTAVLGTYRV